MNFDSGDMHQQYFDWVYLDNSTEESVNVDITQFNAPNVQIERVLLLICADNNSVIRSAALDQRTSSNLDLLLVSTEVIEGDKNISSVFEANNNCKNLLLVDFEHFSDLELLKNISRNHKSEVTRLHIFTRDTNYNNRNRKLAGILDNFPNRSVQLKGENTPINRYIAFFKAVSDIRGALII